jgi:NAD(P)-dependent dehydrogenase (short-subunit alcohol dehydrogenase family)
VAESTASEAQHDSLKGQTALVTGASGGIGAATAIALAERGASVLLHYNSNAESARAVKDAVTKYGVECEFIEADLSRDAGLQSLIASVQSRKIDTLINNAGSLIQRARVAEMTLDLWNQVLMLNLTSSMFLAKAVLRGMAERGHGTIVNLSSVAALNGGGLGAIAYASSKAAVSTMTKGVSKEFAPLGVRVNAVSPGTIDTGFHRAFSTSQMLETVRAATPAGRIGTSEEVADTILFLCSHGARFIHGQVIEVNGGFLMA